MPTLDTELRDLLATVIGKESATTGARVIAETAARAALEALAVALPAPYAHLTGSQRKQRNRLRARARQLGDSLDPKQANPMARLIEQTAYEQWHRMLFARFLAENGLLIHPELGVAVTLEECAEMAEGEFAADGWELAGRYASRMLPQIFRPDDVLLQVALAPEHRAGLEKLLAQLPGALFRASDSLGWCYQFWQARRKKEVNASEVKIGADELPAVTQLFTEPYMVQFLLHNTLGAWWVGAGRALPPGLEMPYLRRLDDGTPAAGTFSGWPRLTRDVKVLDPCCGSGHFLVAAFEILVAFRIAEEGLDARTACDAVLRDNLHGLEIDARCVQIAAFALALAAWTYPGAGGYRPLAPMNVACSGLAISATKAEWEALGGTNERLRNGMGRMWELFKDAPVLGSLIDPTRDPVDPMFVAGFDEVQPLMEQALTIGLNSDDRREFVVAAAGITRAAQLLTRRYTIITTNFPFLLAGNQTTTLKHYTEDTYAEAKNDLATCFLMRSYNSLRENGTTAVVIPHGWLFMKTYKELRQRILRDTSLGILCRLGAGAFETISGEIVQVALFIASKSRPQSGHGFMAMDIGEERPTVRKRDALGSAHLIHEAQSTVIANPESRFTFGYSTLGDCLGKFANSYIGLQTSDNPRFVQAFWEGVVDGHRWKRFQSPVQRRTLYGGRDSRLRWDGGVGALSEIGQIKGTAAWDRQGISIRLMGDLPCTIYGGAIFEQSSAVLVPKRPEYLLPIFAYCSSGEFTNNVRAIDKSIKITNKTFEKIAFDYARWSRVSEADFPDGLPQPSSTQADQWLFLGHPRTSDAPLQVAVARLLGYRWPDQKPDALDALADDDGIVCIPAVRGELPAADRLTELLRAAWGADWHPQTLTDLLAAVGHTGTLQEWLRDSFFKQHCKLFHDRPFVWHIWDGHRDGFSALVNYHKLNHDTLKALTYTYLGDWIRTQEAAPSQQSGAAAKLSSARALQQRLAAILEGEAPLDIFVRWKPLEAQPIGWHPDLDDGVRLNIRPFLTVADVGPKGAGVLRVRPGSSLKWGVDRGNNPPGSPWGEKRDNDRHLTLAEKRKARGM